MPKRMEPANLAVSIEAERSGENPTWAIPDRTRMMAEEFEAGARVQIHAHRRGDAFRAAMEAQFKRSTATTVDNGSVLEGQASNTPASSVRSAR